jgi:hypothetical protein
VLLQPKSYVEGSSRDASGDLTANNTIIGAAAAVAAILLAAGLGVLSRSSDGGARGKEPRS